MPASIYSKPFIFISNTPVSFYNNLKTSLLTNEMRNG